MKTETIILIAGAGIAALAIGNYLLPKKDGQDFATTIGAAAGTAAGEAAGGAVVGAAYGLVLAPWNFGASIGGPAGKALGEWTNAVEASGQDPYHLYHGNVFDVIGSVPTALGDLWNWVF